MTSPYAHRPFFYKATNVLGGIGQRIGLEPSFNSTYLLERAMRTTGLDDFGETEFFTDLEILAQSKKKPGLIQSVSWQQLPICNNYYATVCISNTNVKILRRLLSERLSVQSLLLVYHVVALLCYMPCWLKTPIRVPLLPGRLCIHHHHAPKRIPETNVLRNVQRV